MGEGVDFESSGTRFKFNQETEGWKAQPKALPWSAEELRQFDPEHQAKAEAWKRKAGEREKKEELDAVLDDFIQAGEARCSGLIPHHIHQDTSQDWYQQRRVVSQNLPTPITL